MVEEMLAARGIGVSHETDKVVTNISGKRNWLWRAVDQHGVVLDILVQSRRNTKAAKRLLQKLLKK
jgi:putative transposase